MGKLYVFESRACVASGAPVDHARACAGAAPCRTARIGRSSGVATRLRPARGCPASPRPVISRAMKRLSSRAGSARVIRSGRPARARAPGRPEHGPGSPASERPANRRRAREQRGGVAVLAHAEQHDVERAGAIAASRPPPRPRLLRPWPPPSSVQTMTLAAGGAPGEQAGAHQMLVAGGVIGRIDPALVVQGDGRPCPRPASRVLRARRTGGPGVEPPGTTRLATKRERDRLRQPSGDVVGEPLGQGSVGR